MQHLEHLAEFDEELAAFRCRPATLVADLVVLGFGRDLADTAHAIESFADSPRPHKAYPNARLAFELAQNIVVLATHEDYGAVGARAWVYFEDKDSRWRSVMANRGAHPALPLTEEE